RVYARVNNSYSHSAPRFVRSPLTTTATGSSASISAIAPSFITSGYGASPGAVVNTGPISSGVPSLPHSCSPKCTSFTVAIVARSGPGGPGKVVTEFGSRSVASTPSTASGYSVAGSRPVIRAEWYGPLVVTDRSPTEVATLASSSVWNVTTTS